MKLPVFKTVCNRAVAVIYIRFCVILTIVIEGHGKGFTALITGNS